MSPCVGQCRAADGRCAACGRTLAEIARWSRMSEAEKRDVMARIQRERE